jgi:hypothetical protein
MGETGQVVRMQNANAALRDSFLRWQCRVRQMMMRDDQGRPGDPVMPSLTLPGQAEPMGHIITVMSKAPQYSKTPEMRHMVRKTNDPAQRRQSALTFFSEYYYQKASEFSDILTATFPPDSPGAAAIRAAGRVTLVFAAYGQRPGHAQPAAPGHLLAQPAVQPQPAIGRGDPGLRARLGPFLGRPQPSVIPWPTVTSLPRPR